MFVTDKSLCGLTRAIGVVVAGQQVWRLEDVEKRHRRQLLDQRPLTVDHSENRLPADVDTPVQQGVCVHFAVVGVEAAIVTRQHDQRFVQSIEQRRGRVILRTVKDLPHVVPA